MQANAKASGFSLLLLITISYVFAHAGEEHEDDAEAQLHLASDEIVNNRATTNDLTLVLPFRYFAEGKWIIGLTVIVIWVVMLRAMYVLILMVLGGLIGRK